MNIVRWYDDKNLRYYQGVIEYIKEVFNCEGEFKYFYKLDVVKDAKKIQYKVEISEESISKELVNQIIIEELNSNNNYYYFIDSQWEDKEWSASVICGKIKEKYLKVKNFSGNIMIVLYTSVYGGDEQNKIFNSIYEICKDFAFLYTCKLITTSKFTISETIKDNAQYVKNFVEKVSD